MQPTILINRSLHQQSMLLQALVQIEHLKIIRIAGASTSDQGCAFAVGKSQKTPQCDLRTAEFRTSQRSQGPYFYIAPQSAVFAEFLKTAIFPQSFSAVFDQSRSSQTADSAVTFRVVVVCPRSPFAQLWVIG